MNSQISCDNGADPNHFEDLEHLGVLIKEQMQLGLSRERERDRTIICWHLKIWKAKNAILQSEWSYRSSSVTMVQSCCDGCFRSMYHFFYYIYFIKIFWFLMIFIK